VDTEQVMIRFTKGRHFLRSCCLN